MTSPCPPSRPSLLRANIWYLLASAGLMLLSFAASFFVKSLHLDGKLVNQIVSTVYEIGFLALPVLLYALFSRDNNPYYNMAKSARWAWRKEYLRLRMPNVRMLLFAALLAAVGVFMANYLTTWWLLLLEAFGGTPPASGISVPTNTGELLVSLLLVAIVPGICEEMLFRGGLLSAWSIRNEKSALIVTSVLFALLHGTIAGLPNQLIMGVVLGYIVIISDSLFTGMVYHTVHNSLTLLLAYSAQTLNDPAAAAEMTESISASMGGAEGYIALLIITAVSVAIFTLILRAMIKSAKKRGLYHPLEELNYSRVDRMTLLVQMLPLFAALCIAAINYAADFAATFGS